MLVSGHDFAGIFHSNYDFMKNYLIQLGVLAFIRDDRYRSVLGE